MIKVAFCDDDISALSEISALLDLYREKTEQDITYTTFSSSLELLSDIEKGIRYDILFLDVMIPGENGVSTAKEIRQRDRVVKIIFLTSSSEFAVQSYAVDAYYYQMKPIGEEDFFRLMDSVIGECMKTERRSLILHCKSGITRIDLNRLKYCEVIGRTLVLHMENSNELEKMGSMDELWSQLKQYDNFLRPHRSFLINMEYIQSISHRIILMDNSVEIPIPHGKCSEIKNKYLEYAFNRKLAYLS